MRPKVTNAPPTTAIQFLENYFSDSVADGVFKPFFLCSKMQRYAPNGIASIVLYFELDIDQTLSLT